MSIDDFGIDYLDKINNECYLKNTEYLLKDAKLVNLYNGVYPWTWAKKSIYGHAIPGQSEIDKIIKFINTDGILEVGPGPGQYAPIFKELGIKYNSIDIKDEEKEYQFSHKFYDNDQITLLSLEKALTYDYFKSYPNNVLFLCWPDYKSNFAVDALRAFKNAGGTKFIHRGQIGVKEGACPGPEFIKELESNWKLVDVSEVPHFNTIYERTYFYQYK